MNFTPLFKKVCRIARRLLFPDEPTITVVGQKNDDAGTYGLTLQITDFWYGRRVRPLEDVRLEQAPVDVVDFYVADGVGITFENFKTLERVSTSRRHFDVMVTQEPFGQPAMWRIRCRPRHDV